MEKEREGLGEPESNTHHAGQFRRNWNSFYYAETPLNEAQRFFRYIIPGLISIVELLGYLLISGDLTFCELISRVQNAGTAITAFLGSGAIGFVWGAIYYQIFWELPVFKDGESRNRLKLLSWCGKKMVNHCPVLRDAECRKWLKLRDASEDREVEANKLNRRGAMRVCGAYLNMRADASKNVNEVAMRRLDRLADLVTGLGTTCIGSFFALIGFTFLHCCAWQGHLCRALLSWGFGLIILIFHCKNYFDVSKDCENIHGMIFLKELESECKERLKPITLYVFQEDLGEKRAWVIFLIVMIAIFLVVLSLKNCIF